MPGRSRTKTNCGVCLQKIADGKEEAIFCEGKCQQWYHRGCASVPPELFATLTTSNVPFHCLTCSNSTLQQEVAELTMEIRRLQEAVSVIPKLRDENAALSKQIVELREKQGSLNKDKSADAMTRDETDDSRAPSYARAARAKPGRRNNKQVDKRLQGKNQEQNSQLSMQRQRTAVHVQTSQSKQPLVSVKGARKVWNTYKIVTTSAISQAIHTITGIPTTSLSIKRKFRLNATDNKVAAWWFVIRGEESVLEQLDSSWQQVNLQTKWELKPVLSYAAISENSVSENPSSGSAPIDTLRPVDDAVTSQEDPITGDVNLHVTTTPSAESSFCQPQDPSLVT